MSSSLFSSENENIGSFKSASTDEESQTINESPSTQLAIVGENDSIVSNFHRLCLNCHDFLWTRLSRLLTITFLTLFDLARRLRHIRQSLRAPLPPSPPLSTSVSSTSTSLQTLEDHISLSSINSHLHLEIDSPSMTHLLVHPPLHRSDNIRIRSTKNSTNDSSYHPIVHSVDETLFFSKPDSNDILQLLQRFRSEPQISCCFSITTPPTDDQSDEEESLLNLEHDQIEPVTKNVDDDAKTSDQLDVIFASETTTDDVEEDVLLDTNNETSSILNNGERHFRRRKRRSSFTRTSTSTDEIQQTTNETIDINNNHEEICPIESLSITDAAESSSTSTTTKTPTPTTITGFRSRRLRQRFYRRQSTPSVDFFVTTEPSVFTPPPSPTSPNQTTNVSGGRLKRTGSLGTATKKMVRFADSIGRELAQVQYIQSNIDEEIITPKQILYGLKEMNFEPKPWSFDVALSSRLLFDQQKPKRFCCLYRQPNSEHPDIYLHDVWKNQVKLEHADIRTKSSGDLYLSGTLWVTNASYFKYVTVKYTFNQWMNSYEYEARHRCYSNDFRNIDQFEFNIDIPKDVDRIDFVLRYCVNGQEHWDNNEGRNYTLQSETSSTPQTRISLPHDCDFNEMRFY